jgi:hypothetical protein
VFRNYFLDWDGLGYMSSLEQNFNPSVEDIKRRTDLGQWKKNNSTYSGGRDVIRFFFSVKGYPRLLSGDLLVPKTLASMHKNTLFPGDATAHQFNNNKYRRHLLSFPMYPFRTLCPRDAHNMLRGGNIEFDQTSPLFPANTQLNIKFTRRPVANLLNYMLPTNLNLDLGAANNSLTQDQRDAALNFSVIAPAVANAQPVVTQYVITGIAINLQNIYLQVSVRKIFSLFYFPSPPMLPFLGEPSALQRAQSGKTIVKHLYLLQNTFHTNAKSLPVHIRSGLGDRCPSAHTLPWFCQVSSPPPPFPPSPPFPPPPFPPPPLSPSPLSPSPLSPSLPFWGGEGEGEGEGGGGRGGSRRRPPGGGGQSPPPSEF